MRSSVAVIARTALAAALTAFVLWKSEPRAVVAATAGADWRPIGFAILLVLVDRALMAYRWMVLLCIIETARPPFREVMRIFFVSTFVGTFLPASVGGDAVRAYSLAKLDVRGGDAVASVFMDRMLGVASILVMGVIGLLIARDLAANPTIVASLIVAAAVCGVTLAIIFSDAIASLAARAIRWLPATLSHPVSRLLEAVRRYASHHGRLANVLLASVAVQALRILQAYYLGVGLGIAAPLSTYLAFIPLILLVMLLPVTFNGIGTSQAAFVWFFNRVGVPGSSSFALSVLFVALGIVGNLPGGLLYALGRRRPAPAQS